MISIQDLRFSYPPLDAQAPAVALFQGLSLDVMAGEAVALMGAIGAGKTTLLLTLAGLVPEMTGGTLTGTLTLNGKAVAETPPALLSQHVGIVFQHADHALFNMTVLDEVAFGLEGMALPPDEVERRAREALAEVGLAGLEERAPWQLSGGQQKRLALAVVLAMAPPVILLDEPMAGLDPLGRRTVSEALTRLKAQRGSTILVAEQDPEFVARWAERVVVLADGQIQRDGPPGEVLGDVQSLHRFGIETTQIAMLQAALDLPPTSAFLTATHAAEVLRLTVRARGWPGVTGTRQSPTRTSTPVAPPLSVVDVRFRYPDGPLALDGLSLDVAPGEFVALAGENGSGKSTLTRLFNGLLRPQGGEVRLGGRSIAQQRVGALARQVGYVFQNPDHQIFAPTVREELAFGLRAVGVGEPALTTRVDEALAHFGLASVASTPPAILGYGQRRLVAVAATWVLQPSIWVLDEPTTGLDRVATQALMSRVGELHRQGHTLILVTHDMRLVAEYAERLVVLAQGRVALDGPPAHLFREADTLRPYGLRPPPISRLASKLHPDGFPRDVITLGQFLQLWQSASGEGV